MPSLNRVQIIGNLGKDPEIRYTAKGTPITRFSVAVNRRWTSTDGEHHEQTEWFSVEAWGKLGEFGQKYLRKGRLVYVEGELRTERWEDEKGEPRSTTRIHAERVELLDRRPEEPEPEETE
ncbi:MAG: single-stranded DNA-binding protein [Anaerolineae bacterium]